MSTVDYPMQTMPAATRRLGGFNVRIGEPFIISSREENPHEGTHSHPGLWKSSDTLFLNWNIDRDTIDPRIPDRPNGRLSRDGGRTWQRQTILVPPGGKIMTGPSEITSYWLSFEIPGSPGRYRMATWRSPDNGQSWGDMTWTELEYPGTRGVDYYDPPDAYKRYDTYIISGMMQERPSPPAYLEALFQKAGTRKRGSFFCQITADSTGTLYGLTYLTYGVRYVPGGENIKDERAFYEKLDWFRIPCFMHTSTDGGRTWKCAGVVAYDEKHRIEPGATDIFTEPSLAVYPDGEMVCVMRTGSNKPLYLVRSHNAGVTWSEPVKLPIRGVTPQLVPLAGGVLALATGRPDCTVHFSLDRGKTWPLSQTLFSTTGCVSDKYANSTSNIQLTRIDDHTLLYAHDAFRYDANGEDNWLKNAGYGRIIGRHIFVEKSLRAACISRLAGVCKPLMKLCESRGKGSAGTIPEAIALQRDKKKLTLDGRLDNPFWEGLKVYALRHEDAGKPPAPGLETTFRVAWADNALYIGIDCRENDMPNLNIGSSENGDHKIWEGDSLDLLIQTQTHAYYQIAISPTGAVVGMDRENGMNINWSPGAEVAMHRGKDFWSIELRLTVADPKAANFDPLRGIAGQKPTDETPWHFNLGRQRMRGRERTFHVLSKSEGGLFHELETFGKLTVK